MGSINRWNMYDYAPAERMAYLQQRRAEAAEMAAKNTALATSFATIQSNNIASQGDLFSRIAMERISKTA
jgi:hypothetical protein